LKRAQLLLADGPNYRKADFQAGLLACGYGLVDQIREPRPGDILVTWNRSNWRNNEARRFEAAGARVVVAENGYLGKNWMGHKWFALALGHHSGAGWWPDGGPQRWDSWGAEIAPWSSGGREVMFLEQRGIGEPGIASPRGWEQSLLKRLGGRLRNHPGGAQPAVSLADDLREARCVVTWNSSGALLALLMGVPVFYGFAQWIGRQAARHVSEFDAGPSLGDRLAMFRRLAWAQWTAEEIRLGAAFDRLLEIEAR
jgi:hypothetical protein